jgi:predicted ArsR family transcriptional regulator
MTEPDLFSFGHDTYPSVPGFKARDTAREAAESLKPKAPLVRDKILQLMASPHAEFTADEAASMLGLPILTVRPRFSELANMGKLVDSGVRRRNDSGKNAIAWRRAAA